LLDPRALRDPAVLAAFGFGLGLLPRAPGTFGSLLAIPLWWLMSAFGTAVYLWAATAAFAAGIWACSRAAALTGEHDHPGIVIDEIVGYYVALAVIPMELNWLVVSFFLFRLLDILKPWPIGWLDRTVGGGLGVMLDDLIAGLFTAGVMLAAMRWW
jgi:phosphatidylglycerophosphatase A